MRLKRFLLAVTASAVTFALAMAAAEIYLRRKNVRLDVPPYLAELRTHDGRRISDKTGAVNLELAPFTVYRSAASQRTANFNINSRGLRGDEGIDQDSRPRIVVLGSSAVFGQGAATDADTIPAIVQDSIKSHRLINAGVIGFNSGQELTFLVTEVIDYHPAIVIAYDGWNDVFDTVIRPVRTNNTLGVNSNFFAMEDSLAENYRTGHTLSGGLSRLFSVLSEKSLVVRRFRQAIHRGGNPAAVRTIRDLPAAQQAELMDRVVAAYVNNVRKMALLSQASGAKFLLVFQPELGQRPGRTADEQQLLGTMKVGEASYGDFFPELYRRFLAAAKPRLTQAGVDWIDINENHLYQAEAQTLFLDPVHTNRHGNEVASQILLQKLQPLLASK